MKVLVVDDSRAMRMILRQILREIGFEDVSEAGHGRDALQPFRDAIRFSPEFMDAYILLADLLHQTGARDVSIHQQVWVQEGSIELTVGKVTHRLSEDDCLAMQLNEPTAFRNRTRKVARYIVVLSTEHPRTIKR